jgi:tRNA-2-methylthio-N6-dimethylallyladenosine synthase
VKSSRLAILQQLQKDITLKKNKMLEGAEVEVLVEGDSKKGGQLTGRTRTNKIVNFHCNSNILNKLVNIKIKYSFTNSFIGELLG